MKQVSAPEVAPPPLAQSPSVTAPKSGEDAVSSSDNDRFDVVLERLTSAVQRLEQGNLPLEESLRAFEEGVILARRGHALLDAAERRVEMLTKGTDGADKAVPLPGSETA
ncbi:MAG: exodeoxyribonuclease VII small subunit [Deltaproteobacteria bacterium]|nr:exodeoxyribonuclease VII small subunit [Deltaproteobacteria bacterium]